jgi:hypothetical protein
MKNLLMILVLNAAWQLHAQTPTVGLFLNDSLAYNGYTLYTPLTHTDTWLIDNCGYVVNHWESDYQPAGSVYLLENGNLLRTAKIPNPPFASGGVGGGGGGRIEEYDWNGNLVWEFDYYSSTYIQHHDIHRLPNGNTLILAWEIRDSADCIANGRDPSTFESEIWSEKIIEVQPVGSDSGIIVWEWHMWDHLVQDYDASKQNYGNVAANPQLLNLNYTSGNIAVGGDEDWLHANALAYHEEFDQIMICSRRICEIWVIDHSTTTAEAASHSGGTYGKGGDILYRYGNPAAYDRGSVNDETLFGPHNAHWIPEGYPDEGKVIIFDNQQGSTYSEVEIIDPPVEANGFYTDPGNAAYGPDTAYWSYIGENIYSSFISGAHQMPNGNVLICEGDIGRFVEVTPAKTKVWEYRNPVGMLGPVNQGSTPNFGSVFRATRYEPDYAAFDGITLVPGDPIELNPYNYDCTIYWDITEIKDTTIIDTTKIDTTDTLGTIGHHLIKSRFGLACINPFGDYLEISVTDEAGLATFRLFDLHGREVVRPLTFRNKLTVDARMLAAGIYLVQVTGDKGSYVTDKLVKLE